MFNQTPSKPMRTHGIAALDSARGGFAADPSATAGRKTRPSLLGWVRGLMASRKADNLVLASYQNLYDLDDHLLRDVGVTRLEVLGLIEQSARR